MLKRGISLFLALAMVFCIVPVETMAAETLTVNEFSSMEETPESVSTEETAARDAILREAKVGPLTYSVNEDETTCTVVDCDDNASGDLDIPSTLDGYTVTKIGSMAFAYCRNLSSVIIPDGVTEIGNYAFQGVYIEYIKIPESVQTIGYGIFNYATNLHSAGPIGSGCNIEYGWEEQIPTNAFGDCTYLNKIIIPSSITQIGNDVFLYCDQLTSAGPIGSDCNIEYGWKEKIPDSAFSSCESLREIKFPDTLKSIGNYAFSGCALQSVHIPENVEIGAYAFSGCKELNQVVIPENVTNFASSAAFAGCTSLISAGPIGSGCNIEFGWKEAIPDNAFNSSELEQIIFPSELTSIGNEAFYDCSKLKDVVLPEGLLTIGYSAFAICTSLESVVVPEGTLSIGEGAFYECKNLSSVVIPDGVAVVDFQEGTFLGVFDRCGLLTSAGPIGSGCDIEFGWKEKIPQNAFRESELERVTIPSGVTSIEDNAFCACYTLESVEIPEGVIHIGDGAFTACDFQYIVLPHSIKSIGKGAFSGCDQLKDVYYAGSEEERDSIEIVKTDYPLPTEILEAEWHYNSTGPNDEIDPSTSSKVQLLFFNEWDAENQIAYFEDDLLHLGVEVTDDTDTSFLDTVQDIVGHYVLVETKYRDDGMVGPNILISMEPVEAGTGTVQERTEDSLTVNDTVYPLALKGEDPVVGADKGDEVLYGVQDERIVVLVPLTTNTLHFEHWDPITRELALSHEFTKYTYTVAMLASEESIAILNADRDTSKSYSIKFVCGLNDKIVYRVYGIYEDVDSPEFKIGVDNFSFANSPNDFLTEEEQKVWEDAYFNKQSSQSLFADEMKEWGYSRNIQISDEAINKLLYGQNNIVKQRIQDSLDAVWNGSCFGMATVMATRLVRPSALPIDRILPNNISVSNTFQLPFPNQSEQVENLINYYQLIYAYDYYWEVKEKEVADQVQNDYTSAVLNLIQKIEDDNVPVLACIATSNVSSAHTVILLDVLETTDDFYKIKVYDPNVTSDFTEMKIFRNKSSTSGGELSEEVKDSIRVAYCSSSNAETSSEKYTCLYNYLSAPFEFDIRNYFEANNGYNTQSEDSSSATLRISVDTNVRLYSENSKLNYEDGAITECDGVYGAYPNISSLAEDGRTTELHFLLADSDEKYNIEVSPAESYASAKLELDTWAVYLSSDADIVSEVDDTSKTVTIKSDSGNKCSLSAMIVTNDVTADWPWYAVAIDTEKCSELALSVEEDGVIINGDGLENSTVSVKNDDDIIKQGIDTTSSEVKLINTDKGVVVEPAEPDHVHTLSFVDSVDATCKSTGILAHWHCSGCGRNFSDAAGTVEINNILVPIDPSNHAGGTEIRNAVKATSEAEGYTGDTYCLGCGARIASGTLIPKLTTDNSDALATNEPTTELSSTLPSQPNATTMPEKEATSNAAKADDEEKAQAQETDLANEDSPEPSQTPQANEDESSIQKNDSVVQETEKQDKESGSNILGYAVLVLAAGCVILGAVWYLWRRKKQ